MKISSGSKTLTSRLGTTGLASQGLAAVHPLAEKPEDHPECEEAAWHVYSVPDFKVFAGGRTESCAPRRDEREAKAVIGVGVLPHGGDAEHHRDGSLFAILNEVDSMLDEEKNQGVQAVWGDLYNNPFTGGFFVLPQEHSLQRVQKYAKVSEGMSDPGMRAEYNGDVRADGVARRSHALYPGPG